MLQLHEKPCQHPLPTVFYIMIDKSQALGWDVDARDVYYHFENAEDVADLPVAANGSDTGMTAKTKEEMKIKETYSGFDFYEETMPEHQWLFGTAVAEVSQVGSKSLPYLKQEVTASVSPLNFHIGAAAVGFQSAKYTVSTLGELQNVFYESTPLRGRKRLDVL